MKLIAGLGNPGEKYKNNRHNVGFMVLDSYAVSEGVSWQVNKDLMCFFAKTEQYILIKPTTYMNASGDCVRGVCDYFKIASDDVLVVHDELDLEFGKIRLAFNGSAAGHHGIESVIKGLSTADFGRLRIGVGKGEGGGKEHVLEDFSEEEKKDLTIVLEKSVEAVKSYLMNGLEATMNRFN